MLLFWCHLVSGKILGIHESYGSFPVDTLGRSRYCQLCKIGLRSYSFVGSNGSDNSQVRSYHFLIKCCKCYHVDRIGAVCLCSIWFSRSIPCMLGFSSGRPKLLATLLQIIKNGNFSTFLQSATAGTLCAVMGWMVLYVWFAIYSSFELNAPFPLPTKIANCLNPHIALSYGIQLIGMVIVPKWWL